MSDDFRYYIVEIRDCDLTALRGKTGIGAEGEGRIGQIYAACDDEELTFHIYSFLMRNSGNEPLQLMVFDTVNGNGFQPA